MLQVFSPATNYEKTCGFKVIKFISTLLKILFFRKKNSLIVIQNIYTKKIYSTLLKILLFFQSKYTLYDIDDADYCRHPPETIQYFMKKCQISTVGSHILLDYTKKFSKKVFLLTSPVNFHNFVKNKKK